MKHLNPFLFLSVTLFLSGCVTSHPQTAQEFREAVPGAFLAKVETFVVDRPFRDVAATFERQAPQCLTKRIKTTSQTNTSYQVIVTAYRPTVLMLDNRVELHLQQAQLPPELQVQLLGFVEDIDAQYSEADVFLYRSDHDASSNVLLEAKRWGLPVLVNDFPVFRTIVSDRVSGLLYKGNADFKSSLHRLLSEKALRQSLVENGYREHEEVFTIDASRERLEAALSNAIRAQSVRHTDT